MKKTERVLLAIIIFVIVLKAFQVPGGAFLVVLSLILISLYYCYFSFAIFNNIRMDKIFKKQSYSSTTTLKIVGSILTGFAFSCAITGLLFTLMIWSGAKSMLIAGGFGLSISAGICLFKYNQTKSVFYSNILIRILLLVLIGTFVMYFISI